jgi:hypothetical protein
MNHAVELHPSAIIRRDKRGGHGDEHVHAYAAEVRIDLVAVIVDEYDPAIEFFTGTSDLTSSRTRRRSPTTGAPSVGSKDGRGRRHVRQGAADGPRGG